MSAGGASAWRHLPNGLTLLRIALAPPLYLTLAAREPLAASLLLLLAAASDALDGFLARRYAWQTRLGGLLDPLADKILLNACFLGLWQAEAVPGWLLALVFGRDLVIVAGGAAFHWLIRPLQAEPSLLGKANTATQILFVLWLLLLFVVGPQASHWAAPAIWIVALMALASGTDYVQRWSRRAWRERRR